jgi:hypothetical protein
LHPEFTHFFATNFVVSLDTRASREVFPIEVRSPEIGKDRMKKRNFLAGM